MEHLLVIFSDVQHDRSVDLLFVLVVIIASEYQGVTLSLNRFLKHVTVTVADAMGQTWRDIYFCRFLQNLANIVALMPAIVTVIATREVNISIVVVFRSSDENDVWDGRIKNVFLVAAPNLVTDQLFDCEDDPAKLEPLAAIEFESTLLIANFLVFDDEPKSILCGLIFIFFAFFDPDA